MKRDEYIALYEKFLLENCSEQEKKRLEDYHDRFHLFEGNWDSREMGEKEDIQKAIYQRLKKSVNKQEEPKTNNLNWRLVAAVFAFCLLSASIYWIVNNNRDKTVTNKNELVNADLLPGSDKARLQLGDGSVVVLNDLKEGTIKKQGKIIIAKHQGELVYKVLPGKESNEVVYNTISTPRGGQYKVVLPDGSKVWLNAASSLRFPTSFKGNERRVELHGEGYFEIAHNAAKPFKVSVNKMEVKVLGTHFNIMAYENEGEVRTTLLEGSVEITKAKQNIRLTPGQQALLTKSNGNIKVKNVDADNAIAWKNGYFQFKNESIYSIMRKIARWYDVEISYGKNLTDKSFSGGLSRFENASEVLAMLELTGAIHFKIEGRRIIVMP